MMLRKKSRLGLSLLLVGLTGGCATLPSNYVQVLPAPARSFPPAPPALMRLPVDIVFPSGAQVGQHLDDLFNTALRPKRDKPEKALDARSAFNVLNIWERMQEPIFLDKGIWLLIRPKTLSLGTMRNDPKNILSAHTMIETSSNPEVVFGPEPVTTPIPMPKLSPYLPGPSTFRAVSNTHINYKEVNERLKDPRMKLIGMVVPGTGGQKLTLVGLRVYGSGGQVVVEVKLHYNPLIVNLGSKPAKVTVYLKGTPRYLKESEAFDLPDLDYDLKSSDLMLQMADLFFKNDFRDQLRKIARLSIGPKLAELKDKIDVALNRPLGPVVHLSAKVSSLKVLGGYADNEGIVVRVSIQGTAGLQMVWNKDQAGVK
jgi:hypothetical protein